MYLKKIKISGFKSFIDLTTLLFPTDMTAVVGPNGCGKSNIIDAVRWVLGESSPRHLRGDAMADVIFNGSTSRPAASRASVELLFDNSAQRITHALAPYNEISVRRELLRDGTNQYYLNSKKCRRKDVTELFLGTGLGPRSYAIIEQGMITRLIESKPLELRAFIEEAAGISKYKEKRRTTELHIKQTQDNLARLADIRIELGKQIEKLRIQSATAQQFRALKQQQRQAKNLLGLTQLYDIERQLDQAAERQLKFSTEQEQISAGMTKIDAEITAIDVEMDAINRELAHLQQDFYLHGTEITKLEEKILHHKLLANELINRKQAYQKQYHEISQLLLAETELLEQKRQELAANKNKHERLQGELGVNSEALKSAIDLSAQAEKQQQIFQDKKQRAEAKQALLQKDLLGGRSLLHKTTQQHHDIEQQYAALLSQNKEQEIAEKSRQLQELQQELSVQDRQLSAKQIEFDDLSQQSRAFQQQSAQIAAAIAENNASLLIFNELLDTRGVSEDTSKWLESNFDKLPLKLLERLKVQPGWESAVEKVLGNWLDAYCLDLPLNSPGRELKILDDIAEFQWVNRCEIAVVPDSLAEKVDGHFLTSVLNRVIIVNSRDEALNASREEFGLATARSFITREGDWFSSEHGWLSSASTVAGEEQRSTLKGRIALQREKSQAEAALQQLNQEQTDTEQKNRLLTEQINGNAALLAELKTVQQEKKRKTEQLITELNLLRPHQQHWQERLARLQGNQAKLEASIHSETQQLATVEKQLEAATAEVEALDDDQQFLAFSAQVKADRTKYQQLKQQMLQQVQQLLLEQTRVNVEIEKQQQLIVRTEQQQKDISLKMNDLYDDGQKKEMLTQLETQRKIAVEKQLEIETEKRSKQGILAKQTDAKHELFNKRGRIVKTLQKVKDKIQQLELKQANFKTKQQIQYQQFTEDGIAVDALKHEHAHVLTEKEYQHQLKKIETQLAEIGAVNLAAVDEFEQQSERKRYLDEQTEDLELAIQTLEAAIVKIDKQTRARFATTFDKVNTDLKMLFPKVFGGGAAWLELTSNDLLDAGVSIMARPPGKKNSRISLLSGGEKALTALSLVFAIFRLNPAPFCLLDEVDAPLDEINVGRFCNLVQEMSESVQFIYISHNKLAMEMAKQLIGVTMHEPGVSRIVAVDISTAIELTDT